MEKENGYLKTRTSQWSEAQGLSLNPCTAIDLTYDPE